jgi:hypothetical protein
MPSEVQKNQREVVLEVGAEGGSISLYGFRTDKGWRFAWKVIDQTAELIDEPSLETSSDIVCSWEAALALLDRYPWPTLFPISVHPDFRDRIWSAVQERLRKDEDAQSQSARWRELCHGRDPRAL